MANSGATIRQAAVIPVRDGRVCLITSSNGQRWVIPKGHLEEGKSPAEVALQEAWEEAGLAGALRPAPVGTYLYEKFGNRYHVVVFVLEVTDAADGGYPEAGLRQRAWLPPETAVARVHEPGLRELIRAATSDSRG
jgi:8-oxo-dGTP pyrophosphatase MutT (NUDIX family)